MFCLQRQAVLWQTKSEINAPRGIHGKRQRVFYCVLFGRDAPRSVKNIVSRSVMKFACCLMVLCIVQSCKTEIRLAGTHGSFQSPNFPKQYGDNVKLEWVIEVKSGYRIKLKFMSFDLEDSYDEDLGGPCVYDYVVIKEGNRTLGRFCGNSAKYCHDCPRLYNWIFSDQNKITVTFVSDFSNEGINPIGFQAHYVEDDIDECHLLRHQEASLMEDWDQLITCSHFCHNVPGNYYCSCRHGFTLHENSHTCVATFCENQLSTDEEGVITSPDYPRHYAKLSHCSWAIKVESGLSIQIAFDRNFAIEEHDEEGCVYDRLLISYKGKVDTYCGTNAPQNGSLMDMNTNEVKIEFQTDLSVEMKGFKMRYNTSKTRCLGRLSAPKHGAIVSDLSKGFHEFRDVVEFSCIRGYELEGVKKLRCLHSGTWDHPTPTCRIKSCGKPEKLLKVKNSHIVSYNDTKTNYLDVVRVECDKWYEMVEGADTWICENDKKWVENGTVIAPNGRQNTPICKPICGVKGTSEKGIFRSLIAGGTKSKAHEWPWVVFLNFGAHKSLKATYHICGGSLISPNYVLTAAHCVNSTDYEGHVRWANMTHVWLGAHDRQTEDMSKVKYVMAAEVKLHPMYYKKFTLDFDVALIRLSEAITMTDARRPVCLPTKDEDFDLASPDKSGYVAGWGQYASWKVSYPLLHALFPIVDTNTCWNEFKTISEKQRVDMPAAFKITDNMFCAGRPGGGQATCMGDSGGPIMVEKYNTRIFYQVGLVSFGIDAVCNKTFTYTVFTKLNRNIVDWIKKNTNNLE